MKVLGIETSGNIGGVALGQDNRIVIAGNLGSPALHDKELVSAIKSLLHEAGWTPRDIDLIAVDVGPGSYTGLRVGTTCAKTLAYSLNKPVIDVPAFDAIAESYPMNSTPICPIMDARRGHVYACIYQLENAQRKRVSDFLIIQPERLVSLLPRPVIIFGNGVLLHKKQLQQKDIFTDTENLAVPKVEYIALLGESAYKAGRRCEVDKLLPLYLRRTEAEEKKAV
ncbi:MAG: tRNA (adenosine(37)-N6)-threonylcarbamoyltransferase complex dimerization subunit type 1 TsaB [Planctomycetes bacterium]|nr:tRNA (adenosine(37)-N6)-threonylcarbamoyltransferase complex dimerization subunit type 1 TsaB [Planctomycetota bacterium]